MTGFQQIAFITLLSVVSCRKSSVEIRPDAGESATQAAPKQFHLAREGVDLSIFLAVTSEGSDTQATLDLSRPEAQ
jgi:hypothetical protein